MREWAISLILLLWNETLTILTWLFLLNNVLRIILFNTLKPEFQNGYQFCRRQFQMHFLDRKKKWLKNHLSLFTGSNYWQHQKVSIGEENGLAPGRPIASTWTHDDLVCWRFYASLNLNEAVKWNHYLCSRVWLLYNWYHFSKITLKHVLQCLWGII